MTFNQLDNLLSPTSSQFISLINASSVISENWIDLPDSTSSTVEVSSTLEQVNCKNTYYII